MPKRPRIPRKLLFATAAVAVLLADAAARHRSVRRTDRAGLLIVQIDGLGLQALHAAMRQGTAPFLAGLLDGGEASLAPWDAIIPPTTPASQAGFLHGRNANIPGFRWYEKSERRQFVANHPLDASEILHRVSDGHGLLAEGGASIGNLLTGDATRSYLTMATVAEQPQTPGTLIRLRTFFVSPLNAIRIVLGMARQFGKEIYQAWRQEREHVEPRMHRGLESALERAFLNSLVRNVSTELVMAEMRLGTPVIFVDYMGYDAVGHHAGPERPESLHAVLGIDRAIRRLVGAARTAKRPYRLVVLSDHGQSLGMPFARRYGMPFHQFVADGMGGDVVSSESDETEHGHALALIGREVAGALGMTRVSERASELARTLVAAARGRRRGAPRDPDLVVCASGNLAHVYFTAVPGRMSMDAIAGRYPALLDRLLAHPAVGILLVRDGGGAPVVIGRGGRRDLTRGTVEGEDPLLPYGSLAAPGLLRLDSFTNTGDVVVISGVNADTGEVTSFESLVGCHGGLGGTQSEAFILYPREWQLGPEPLTGADAVHRQLRSWLAALQV